MITAAALCPSPPLLAREVTGRDPVVPELRQACAEAVRRLVCCEPDVIAVVGPAPGTARWPADRLDLSGFAPQAALADLPEAAGAPHAAGVAAPDQPRPPGPPGRPASLPLALGLGTRLLDQAGYAGTRVLEAVGYDEPRAGCVALGEQVAASGGRVGLLIMADGSARRGTRAPGYLDERAAAFDAAVEDAVRNGDLDALLDIDPALARELLAAGRPAWQVLAGAVHAQPPADAVHAQPPVGAVHGQPPAGGARDQPPAAEILYSGDPFGVAYLVAWIPRQGRGPGS
jgi:hypothetical protein